MVLAGGSGSRVGADRNKVYLPVAGRSVLAWSVDALAGAPGVGPVVLVVRAEDREQARRVLAEECEHASAVEVVDGGATRQGSELAGLRALAARISSGEVDVVLVHDGARPLAGPGLVAEVLRVARESGGAVPGVGRTDLAVADGTGLSAPVRLTAVQTPQGFRAAPLLAAYERAEREGFAGTDTASCVERFAPEVAVRLVAGDPRNVKITYAHDLDVVAGALAGP
ncbi:IspD/TarI family cytidylyltransferase [Pseudonocardia abyssalis]|jgi:2-C-methyl-D-erythritol 4-phosphate cytidylyltransferase|uniref:2-C-methyl-D-erythritol 4-phosphate cytidylyltransferase n=1 Tax=Pseudonocardia abyssalis TaxID=2792008 RepID=A0ABS6UV34_9PSEU|nr:2-C-methyl-D-erythritol 4-phosphate cytidylyltransferase [Pseudonocardia abyssalis]MBW0116917.1 2-C-methyl-D-erythritol 4-phosphate cytidylyltransferase [Pseudonocardia abyssalis]MBW0136104.1 2-C-methyl-D-erythritol 4-phosphate cytidylyltransferase [Pseudonocardia abyssalis]